jgi:hypothetical protein
MVYSDGDADISYKVATICGPGMMARYKTTEERIRLILRIRSSYTLHAELLTESDIDPDLARTPA